jgi:tetratricopeptide (TPR) repeat protein
MGILPLLARQHRDQTSLVLLEALRARALARRASLDALAALYEKRKQYGEARAVLEQAAQIEGKVDVPLLMALSRLAWQQRDYQAVLSYLGQARELEPKNAAVHFFFGMTAVAIDLPVEAKKSLAKAVQLDPENAYAHYAYGAVLAQERDATPSIRHFEEYVKRRPEDLRGRFALAAAYFLANLFDEAKTRLTPLTTDKQTAAGAHYFLGRIARREGRLEDAERELKSSVAMLADEALYQADVLAELGSVYLSLDKPALAEQHLARALQIDPDHFNANTRLLALYQRLEDPRVAQQAARVEEVKRKRSEKEQSLWRTLEIRPY